MLRKTTLIAFAFAAAAYGLDASAADVNPRYYGAPAAAGTASRVIEITESTKHVRVTNGEIVTFSIGGQRYTWSFQLYGQEGALALAEILPQNIRADGVTVYVAADPLYR